MSVADCNLGWSFGEVAKFGEGNLELTGIIAQNELF